MLRFSDDTVVYTTSGTWEIEIPPQNYPGQVTENLIAATETVGTGLKRDNYVMTVSAECNVNSPSVLAP